MRGLKLGDNSRIILKERKTERKRNSNIDFARIVACIAVVGLHTFPRECSIGTLLTYYFCGFAIPFFFMASGFFLLNRGKVNWNYPLKKMLSILRIVVLWNLVFNILKSVAKIYSTGKLYIELLSVPKYIVKSFLQKGEMGHLWYLGALIILYLLLPCISKKSLKTKKFMLFIIGAVCFTFQIISLFIKHPLQAYIIQTFRVWTWLFYFLLGGFIKRITSWIENEIRFERHLLLTILVTGIVLATHYVIGTRVILLDGRILKAEYFYDCILEVIWVTSFFSLLIRVKLHEQMERLIQKIESLTLGIYIIHFPFSIIVVHFMKVNSLTKAICFWLIVLIGSSGITWIIGKTRIGHYLTKI